MGDRANVVIPQRKGELYLYTHWCGTELPFDVQAALKMKSRWDDDAYLARIIFEKMLERSDSEETGFGISVGEPCDNEHLFIKVDCEQQLVSFETDGGREVKGVWSFEEYTALSSDEIRAAYQG